ncbi:heme-dependent oxidative N-demethylase family protein [Boseongicola aestuarii]|uniref:DUF3445 domain-containing protein n=1 Tax=Boseongicola aestuarii TaxID=1470561 RepID=A0A238J547_9RHOB|nr:DUF3445 domain-containing protein [Boseongicola aestuarii]SMX25080.1 hypothetical protein BOA8489_03214 [Boseongicola aestuarii]
MDDIVLQQSLEGITWLEPGRRALPGVQPLGDADWLVVDDAFAGQMRLRDDLISGLPQEVYAQEPEAEAAAQECLDLVLEVCSGNPAYVVGPRLVYRPDGVEVVVNRERPLLTIGRLIQEDICILQRRGREHVLTGAILCFPSHWTLAEKIGRPLTRIHVPVASYDDDIARRVQRLFDGIKVGRPLWRANILRHAAGVLHHPRREAEPDPSDGKPLRFLRSERQVMTRLPKSDAVVFSIHTHVWARDTLPDSLQSAYFS